MAEAKWISELLPAAQAGLCCMNYTRRQLDEMARQLIRDGFFFYRFDFVWGFTPAFRNVRGTEFYFIANGAVLTPRQMYTHLVKTWHPTAPDEQMFFRNRLTAHFAALPRDVPIWRGASPTEMLSTDVYQSTQGELVGRSDNAYAT
jgi:hypothetical protein